MSSNDCSVLPVSRHGSFVVHRATSSGPVERILTGREMFLGFLIARLKDRETAEDVLHSSYVKAVEHAGELRDG